MATKEWCSANREKMRYSTDKSAAKRFAAKATDRDLKALDDLVQDEVESRAKTRDKEH